MLSAGALEAKVETATRTLFSGSVEMRSGSEYFIPARAAFRSMRVPARLRCRCFEFLPFPFSSAYKSRRRFSVWIRNRLSVFLCCEAEISACAVARAQLSKRFTGRFSAFQGRKGAAPVAPAASMCRVFSLDCRCDAVKGEQVRESVAFKLL